jgi:hypothetical protein
VPPDRAGIIAIGHGVLSSAALLCFRGHGCVSLLPPRERQDQKGSEDQGGLMCGNLRKKVRGADNGRRESEAHSVNDKPRNKQRSDQSRIRHAATHQHTPFQRLTKAILSPFVVAFYVYTFNHKPEEKWKFPKNRSHANNPAKHLAVVRVKNISVGIYQIA